MALPAPTALASTDRFMIAGKSKYVWVPTCVDYTAPTSAELTAGTDLSGQIMSVSGFTVQTNNLDAPDAGKRFTSKTPGRITADDSAFSIYRDASSDDVRSLLTRDLEGFVAIFTEGIISGGTLDMYPVTVTSASKNEDIEAVGNIEISFVITDIPATDIDIPTS